MMMNIRDQLLGAFAALAPQTDNTKAILEVDPSAVGISRLLSEPQGLMLVEYILENLECGKKPIYFMNRFVERAVFQKLIEQYYFAQEQKILSILLLCYDQFWVNVPENSRELYEAVRKLELSDAIDSKRVVLNLCLDCYSNLVEASEGCDKCGRKDLLKIYALSLATSARDVLKNNHHLEIYVKECLKESGIELIGWEIDKKGTKAYTSIKYQVDGEPIDVDAHGISQTSAILLCEVKTSQKIPMNEIRRVEGLFERLIQKLHDLTPIKKIPHLKLFIITGEFDQNISKAAYRRKNWELIERPMIQSLAEEFKRIKNEL